MEDDFYATIKLKSGEEIFTKVAASEEGNRIMLIMTNPIMIEQVKSRIGNIGYRIEPWLKTTSDDMFIIDLDNVVTMSESEDIKIILMYQDYVRNKDNENGGHDSNNKSNINRRMGYLSSVNDAKEVLEKIYKNTKNSKNNS